MYEIITPVILITFIENIHLGAYVEIFAKRIVNLLSLKTYNLKKAFGTAVQYIILNV